MQYYLERTPYREGKRVILRTGSGCGVCIVNPLLGNSGPTGKLFYTNISRGEDYA